MRKNLFVGPVIVAVSVMSACGTKPLEQRAAEGDVSAQYELACRFENGDSLHQQNLDSAYYWYDMAVAGGDSAAISRMVREYYDGVNVPQQLKKAFAYAQKGDSLNDPVSQYLLALCYESGTETARSLPRTLELLEKSAAQGYAPAQTVLGWYNNYGVGMPQNRDKAFELFKKSAEAGDNEGLLFLAGCYRNGWGTEVDVEKSKEMTAKLIKTLEEKGAKGDYRALYLLGAMCAQRLAGKTDRWGDIMPDYGKSAEYMQQAADMGYAPAMREIGYLYSDGNGMSRDRAKANEWFEKAIAKGDACALMALGWQYEDGNGVDKDYAKAMELYKKAVAKGVGAAYSNIGYMYKKGLGVNRSETEKAKNYQLGAELNSEICQWNLGVSYDHGAGVPRNRDLGMELMRKAGANSYSNWWLGYRHPGE